ncbi:hypothetical protein F2Q69_00063246 [Brassica cretica]|uniref:Uncharacterized protein n=1 Tax=Brassica cretica TaxID=69181 RepID=A0A8S9RL56_BRACR|nr:hypothetical protein F2Q69_00063246 [Brassica cretica]
MVCNSRCRLQSDQLSSRLSSVIVADRSKPHRRATMANSSLFAKQVPELLVLYKSAQYFGMCRNDLTN